MTYGVAGSNPVAWTSNGKGVAQLAEHIRCFTKTLSSCDFRVHSRDWWEMVQCTDQEEGQA
jgi:hypothetical protein